MSLPEHVKGKDCHTLDTSTGKMSGWGRERGALLEYMVIKDETLEYKGV